MSSRLVSCTGRATTLLKSAHRGVPPLPAFNQNSSNLSSGFRNCPSVISAFPTPFSHHRHLHSSSSSSSPIGFKSAISLTTKRPSQTSPRFHFFSERTQHPRCFSSQDANANANETAQNPQQKQPQPHLKQTENVAAKFQLGVGGPGTGIKDGDMAIIYTCKVCSTRSMKRFTKWSYTRGVVIVQCPGCKNLHLIADNLGWISNSGKNIEDFARERGIPITKTTSGDLMLAIPSEEVEFDTTTTAESTVTATASMTVKVSSSQLAEVGTSTSSTA